MDYFWKKFIEWLNQNAWLKRYIDMNVNLRKKAKNDFKKDFFLSWWIAQFSEKLWKYEKT